MRVPASTYRLQLRNGVGFCEARAILPYLDALGVACVYTSPYLKAQRGSTHGYDVVDWSALDPSLGTWEDYHAFTDEIRARGMGHLIDIVPNHVGIGTLEQAWWWDVLENGPSSLHAEAFDIEWAPPRASLADRLLLPILGRQLGMALEAGEIRLERCGSWLALRYFDKHLPVAPRSAILLLERVLAKLPDPDDEDAVEIASVVTALKHLPTSHERAPEGRIERAREKEVIKRRLAAVVARSARASMALDEALRETNGTPGDPRSFDALEVMLDQQSYRLAFWRVATEEINYRRFFDINELAAVRMEESGVFDAAHTLIFRLIDEGRVTGLRIDHADGLYDPAAYLRRLSRGRGRIWVIVEKILEGDERLPEDWDVDGTTGYDALAELTGVLVDPSAERAMTELYQRTTGDLTSWDEHVHAAKRLALRTSFASEVNMLAQALLRIAEADRRSRDFTLRGLTHALVETLACFPVYRTYIHPDGARTESDERDVERAIRRARRRSEQSGEVFDFLRDVLLVRPLDGSRDRIARFAMRVQQMTGPVMAKGVEDTAFYRFARFVTLNEVGSSPDRFGRSVGELHAHNVERRARRPWSMTSTSTHDSKRGEDVRAKLAVLSEMPDEWARLVERWTTVARDHQTSREGERVPSGTDAYLFLQTVVGALPLDPGAEPPPDFAERIVAYMTKAAKEAKVRTSWLVPDAAYDEALARFCREMLQDARFIDEARALAARIAPHAASNGLTQVLLKLCSPGVPDIYQGSETWNLTLVDPDNRRRLDFEHLARLVADEAPAHEQMARYWDGAIKARVTRNLLRARRADPDLFLDGTYEPIDAGEHLIAFARRAENRALVAVAARLPYQTVCGETRFPVGASWGDASIAVPPGTYDDLVTGARIEAGPRLFARDALRTVPVAALVLASTPE